MARAGARRPLGDLTTAFAGKPGAYDAEARLGEMGADGVVAEVLYPSLAMKLFTLDRTCRPRASAATTSGSPPSARSARHGSSAWASCPPMTSTARSRRCAGGEHGLRGVMIWQSPHPDLPFTGPHYEPFWAECAARGLPVSLHAITGFDHSQELFDRMAASDLEYGVDFYRVTNFCLTTVLDSLLDIVFAGVLDRHPGLRVVLVENEVNWLPFILDQWDFFYGRFHSDGLPLRRRPSEAFRPRCSRPICRMGTSRTPSPSSGRGTSCGRTTTRTTCPRGRTRAR